MKLGISISVAFLCVLNLQYLHAGPCDSASCSQLLANPSCPPEGSPGSGQSPECEDNRSGCVSSKTVTSADACDPFYRMEDGGTESCTCPPRLNPDTGEMEPGSAVTGFNAVYVKNRWAERGYCSYADGAPPQCCSDTTTTSYCKTYLANETLAGHCVRFRNTCVFGMYA